MQRRQVRRADSDSLRLGQGGGSNARHPKGRPRSGCSDDPLRSLTSRSLAKALRGNAPRGLAPPMLSRGMLPRNIGCRLGAPWHSPLRPSWGSIRFHVAESKAALSAPPNSKNDPEAGKSGNSGRFLFSSLFLLCYLLLQKLAKSLISLSDCPFGLYRPPCFY